MKTHEPVTPLAAPSCTRALVTTVLLLGGATALTLGGYTPGVEADPSFNFMRLWRKARAAEAYRLAHPQLASESTVPRKEFVGPPVPEHLRMAQAAAGSRRGAIGPLFGPEAFAGAMNTTISMQGEVRGPNYRGAPLPSTGAVVPLPGEYSTGPEVTPDVPTSELSSEIPDLRRIALSRLANPDPTSTPTGAATVKPSSPAAATAASQVPLTLKLGAVRPRSGYRPGDDVAVRLSASVASYAAVIRVDAAGKAALAFKSPGPSTTFGCVIKAGPTSGSEYLVAVASVKPLNGADVVQALRTVGMTYASAAPAEGGLQPATAWNTAVGFASGAFPAAPAGAARWARSEFAVTGVSLAVRAPESVAKKPAPAKPAATPSTSKPTDSKPADSVLPTETPKPEPPPAESEQKETPQVAPVTPTEKGAKWDLPPTTRRRPGAKPNGATLEFEPADVREGLPSVASLAGPSSAIEPES